MITTSFLVFVLVAQFVLAFSFLWRINSGFYLQDIRVFFLISFALYTLFYPVTQVVLGFFVEETPYMLTIISYNLAILAFNIIIFTKRIKWPGHADIRIDKERKSFWLGIIFTGGLVLYSFYFMYSLGIPVFSFSSFNIDRLDYFQNVNQLWVVLKFIVAGAGSYILFYFKKLSVSQKAAILSILVFYIIFQISIGNRNEFVLIVLFGMGLFLSFRKKPISMRISIVLLLLFLSSFSITVMRSADSRNLKGDAAVQLVMTNNEFMFPIQTTYYIIKDKWDLRYGETYVIHPIKQIIPRSLQKNKPQDLGSEFISKTFGPGWSGWAYTPVTEAYLNFGIVGPFFIYLIIALILQKLVVGVRKEGVSYKYLIAYSIMFNFCRGDVSSTIYMLFFLWLTYLVMKNIVPKGK